MTSPEIVVRPARTQDVPLIAQLLEPYVDDRIMLGKEAVQLYEGVQEFRVAETRDGEVVGCGALHVMWEDIAEVRSICTARSEAGRGVGHAILERLKEDAKALGITRLVCLTFETRFFARHGFVEVDEQVIDGNTYVQLLRSRDEGVAEFLDLAWVRPNTLGNTRMLAVLPADD